MKKLKVGIIGCGAIGSEIAAACQGRLNDHIDLLAICDIDPKKTSELNSSLERKVLVMQLDEIIEKADLVIEASSASISAKVVEKCIEGKTNCLVMSVGGLLGEERLLKLAESRGVKVYMPSGALCGIDGLKAASIGKIDSVTLTTRKPPKGLEGAPYLKKKGIDVLSLKGETVIFEGNAEEAVEGFPQNVNVSAVLSLAGVGARKTRVRIVTSPDYSKNIHEVEITGEFGKIVTRSENLPSKTNPKTSALAIFSAIAKIEQIIKNVQIGT